MACGSSRSRWAAYRAQLLVLELSGMHFFGELAHSRPDLLDTTCYPCCQANNFVVFRQFFQARPSSRGDDVWTDRPATAGRNKRSQGSAWGDRLQRPGYEPRGASALLREDSRRSGFSPASRARWPCGKEVGRETGEASRFTVAVSAAIAPLESRSVEGANRSHLGCFSTVSCRPQHAL